MVKLYQNCIKTTREEAVSVAAKRGRPPITPEGKEQLMISYAMDLAEQQLREGTASAQVICHFLKLGTSRAELEKEKLARENELLKVKAENIKAMERQEEMFKEAINAMKRYQGRGSEEDYEFEEYYED